MGHWIKQAIHSFSEKGGIFMFLRAQFSSQIASITDIGITIILGIVLNIYYVIATFAGSVCGGIINCAINYKWTFKSQGIKKSHVAVKYTLVWVFSIFLNTFGTYVLTEFLSRIAWLEKLLGTFFDDIFIVSKVIVSLFVGFLWNYNMHRCFVYKDIDFKKFFSKNNTYEQ